MDVRRLPCFMQRNYRLHRHDCLREGFRFISELFDMYYPLPSELNPTAQELYKKNLFCITKELAYSKENDIDPRKLKQ